jgi:hypothetical protein
MDVCDKLNEVPNTPYSCPLQPGDYDFTQSFTLPSDIPNGKFDVTIRIRDQNSRQVTCAAVKLWF